MVQGAGDRRTAIRIGSSRGSYGAVDTDLNEAVQDTKAVMAATCILRRIGTAQFAEPNASRAYSALAFLQTKERSMEVIFFRTMVDVERHSPYIARLFRTGIHSANDAYVKAAVRLFEAHMRVSHWREAAAFRA